MASPTDLKSVISSRFSLPRLGPRTPSPSLPGLTLIPVFLLILLQKSSHLFESREFTTAHLTFAPQRSLGGGSPPGPLNRRSPASTRRPRAMYFVATALAAAVLTAVT